MVFLADIFWSVQDFTKGLQDNSQVISVPMVSAHRAGTRKQLPVMASGRKALLFITLQNVSLIWLFSDAVYLFSCNSLLGDQSMERICIWSLCSTPKGCSHNQVLGSAVCHFKSNQSWMSAGALISVKSWFSAILQGYFTKIKRITIHKIRADFIRINKPSVEFSEWNWRHGNHLLELLTGRKLITVYLYSREQSQMPDRLGTLATYIIAQLIFF